MGIFSIFKRGRKKRGQEIDEAFFPNDARKEEESESTKEENKEAKLEKESWNLRDKEERKSYIRYNCEKVMEAKKAFEEAKIEYGQVNAYLNDMQMIDGVEGEGRRQMEDAARNIVMLTRERSDYLNRAVKITKDQYGRMDQYEKDMEREIRELKKNEEYGLKIRSDMNHLENEKTALRNEQKEIVDKQYFLKQLSIITVVLVFSLFLLFYVFWRIFEVNMIVPYLLSILFATAVFFYIFYETQRNKREIRLVEQKQNRAITLLNKVKIKYVNNATLLESVYARLQVENSIELEYIWKQYLLAKEEEKKHRENTRNLTKNGEALTSLLKDFHISDPEVWIYQATALLDRKEMVEIRHRLNTRRQKIRKRMEYNRGVRESSENELNKLLKQMPDVKREMMEILGEYQVELETS